MTDSKLTHEEAYLAMYSFLDGYYNRGKSVEIGGLLGSMSLLQDGGTADAAMMHDWNDAVNKVKEGKVNAFLQLSQPS